MTPSPAKPNVQKCFFFLNAKELSCQASQIFPVFFDFFFGSSEFFFLQIAEATLKGESIP